MSTINPKVLTPVVVAAIGTITSAIVRGGADKATLTAAVMTVLGAVVGYLTPAERASVSREINAIAGAEPRIARAVKKLVRRPPRFLTMYDTTTPDQVPRNPQAVAGYVGGNSWPDYDEMVRRFPKAHHLSIAAQASFNADALDIEQGDASPAEAAEWVKRQHNRGTRRPVLYASLSVMGTIEQVLRDHGIRRDQVRLWSAHYTYAPHIDAGMDGTQWTDHALGRNVDESLLLGNFFDPV